MCDANSNEMKTCHYLSYSHCKNVKGYLNFHMSMIEVEFQEHGVVEVKNNLPEMLDRETGVECVSLRYLGSNL